MRQISVDTLWSLVVLAGFLALFVAVELSRLICAWARWKRWEFDEPDSYVTYRSDTEDEAR